MMLILMCLCANTVFTHWVNRYRIRNNATRKS